MELTEKDTYRKYETLKDDEKLYAILGAVEEPVTKERAIELSGINYKSLDDEQKAKVDSAFTKEGIDFTEESGVKKYLLRNQERERLGKSVDMVTTYRVIANKMREEIQGKNELTK